MYSINYQNDELQAMLVRKVPSEGLPWHDQKLRLTANTSEFQASESRWSKCRLIAVMNAITDGPRFDKISTLGRPKNRPA